MKPETKALIAEAEPAPPAGLDGGAEILGGLTFHRALSDEEVRAVEGEMMRDPAACIGAARKA